MVLKVSWRQALAWRMERQLLDPIRPASPEDVVRRLCGVQAQVASSAEVAVRVRQQAPRAGDVARALSQGRLIKTWAMRGTLHLMTPEDAGPFLSLLAAGRSWERPSWQRWFGVGPEEMDGMRDVVREALDGRILTRDELIEAVTAQSGLSHLGEGLRSGWGTLLKPLAWHGDLCFGPSRGTRVTFMRPQDASSNWAGVPEADEAAPRAILAYLGGYGPASVTHFGNWMARGRISAKQLKTWFGRLGDLVTEADVDGERAYVRAEDLEALAAARPSSTTRLLPGFDQWVLGPGTEDGHVVPVGRRTAVSRRAGWIAPIVVRGGVVSGTWELERDRIIVAWFREAGRPPSRAITDEVERLAAILDRDLRAEIRLA